MIFSEQPPSNQWAALNYRGEKFAEVWFKPEGDPLALIFRIPQQSFQIPGMGQQLTTENLLKAVAVAPEDIESWHLGDDSHSGMNGTNPELRNPLRLSPQDDWQLDILVRLMPPPQTVTNHSSGGQEMSTVKWEDLEVRWKTILGVEATMDTLRISVEGLLAEMEASLKKTLTMEEKLHASRSDVAQWGKAKSRVHHSIPKVREFIHRCTWAMGSPERKHLAELAKNHILPHISFPGMDQILKQLENLQKDRQVLSSHGQAVYHECKSIAATVQGALMTLQSNAALNARKKKGEKGPKGKFFKDIRRLSGAE